MGLLLGLFLGCLMMRGGVQHEKRQNLKNPRPGKSYLGDGEYLYVDIIELETIEMVAVQVGTISAA